MGAVQFGHLGNHRAEVVAPLSGLGVPVGQPSKRNPRLFPYGCKYLNRLFVGLQVLVGSGGGVIKLFDSSSSKYHWEIASDSKYPK